MITVSYREQLGRFLVFSVAFAALLGGCGKKNLVKQTPTETFAELEEQVVAAKRSQDHDRVIHSLETLIAHAPDNPKIPEYKLELADLSVQEGQFPVAYERFRQFCRLYPAHPKIEYAHYQAIVAKYYQTLKISRDCDTSDTQETIQLCDQYLHNSLFGSYHSEVGDIRAACEERMVDKEIHVYHAYLRRGKLQSAKNRLDNLKTTYLSKDQSLKPRILYLECKLAQHQANEVLAKKNLEELTKDYPESQFTRMAEGLLSHRTFSLL